MSVHGGDQGTNDGSPFPIPVIAHHSLPWTSAWSPQDDLQLLGHGVADTVGCLLHLFSLATVTNYHKLSGLKQQIYSPTVLEVRNLKSLSPGLSRVLPSGGSERKIYPCLFYLLVTTSILWLGTPSLFKTHYSSLCFCHDIAPSSDPDPPVSLLQGPCDTLGAMIASSPPR